MRRILSSLTIILSFLFCQFASVNAAEKLTVTFFGSANCRECGEIKEAILSPLMQDLDSVLVVKIKDIEKPTDMKLSFAMEKAYGLTKSSPQELYLPDTVLCGYDAIMADGERLIRNYASDRSKWKSKFVVGDSTVELASTADVIRKRMDTFTFIGLFAAGFVDGINPCAIGTMIFLISFLGTQKRRRSDMLKIGLTFTATVFVTYLSIGLGTFRILTALKQFYWLSFAIRAFAVTVAVSVAAVCIRDAIVFYRTRDVSKIKDQLPKPIKMLIHKVIKGNLSSEKIVLGAIVAGFVVTLLEGACTAKIYLPTIVVMTQQFGFRAIGWLLLLFYNFLFVLPLLIVLISAAYGMKWEKLAKFTQNHLPLMKVLLALVLLAMAAFLTIG